MSNLGIAGSIQVGRRTTDDQIRSGNIDPIVVRAMEVNELLTLRNPTISTFMRLFERTGPSSYARSVVEGSRVLCFSNSPDKNGLEKFTFLYYDTDDVLTQGNIQLGIFYCDFLFTEGDPREIGKIQEYHDNGYIFLESDD